MSGFDYDWLIVGSGFGGSVSALRLSEKGHRVGVFECGRRFTDADMPRSTWDLRRYFWAPLLGMRGIFRLTPFKDVSVISGSGVGGGSLGYANTLYVPPRRFFEDRQWSGLVADWESELAPHYATAERMLGVTENVLDDPSDQLLLEFARAKGVQHTYAKTRVGVFFGEPGTTVADPYFDGEGPARTGCLRCGRCMVGCPHGAKNTLVKNYLYLAERRGADVMADRLVVDVRPLGDADDGSDGYAVTTVRPGYWLRKRTQVHTARGVVFAAGALGTNRLLQQCRANGSLKLSQRLGDLVRTNSEAILAVTVPPNYPEDLIKRVAISSSIYPDPDTHIETVTYGEAGDSISLLYTLLVGDGTRITRPLRFAGAIARHPGRLLKLLLTRRGWSRRTIILLVMQTLDNAIALRPQVSRKGHVRLQTEQDPLRPNPTFIPVANEAAEWFANRTGGVAQSSISEALFNIPTTAHILGGAVIGGSPEDGVVDAKQRVFGYENMLVCDGSAIPANPGVNPSLTITALAEHAMSFVAQAGAPPVQGAPPDRAQVPMFQSRAGG